MVIRFLFTRLLIQHQEEGISYKVDQSQVMWLMASYFPLYMKEYTVVVEYIKLCIQTKSHLIMEK